MKPGDLCQSVDKDGNVLWHSLSDDQRGGFIASVNSRVVKVIPGDLLLVVASLTGHKRFIDGGHWLFVLHGENYGFIGSSFVKVLEPC